MGSDVLLRIALHRAVPATQILQAGSPGVDAWARPTAAAAVHGRRIAEAVIFSISRILSSLRNIGDLPSSKEKSRHDSPGRLTDPAGSYPKPVDQALCPGQ